MSMASSTPKNGLVTAKQNLSSALSPADWKAYLGLLKQWFKRIIIKETFDSEARKICAADRRCLQRHNDFLLAIFSTCQSVSTTSGGSGVLIAASSPVAAASAVMNPSAAVVKLATSGVPPTVESGSSPVVVVDDGVSKAARSGSQLGSVEFTNAASMTSAKSAANASSSHPSSAPPASSVGVPSPIPAPAAAASAHPNASVHPNAASSHPNASPSRTLSSSVTSPAVASPTHPTLAKSSKTRHKKEAKVKKPKTNKISFHNNFTPTNPLAYCQQILPKPPEEELGLSFTYRDRTLPDSSLIHGRMLVGAWDVGLENVDEAAVRFLQLAVETHVRALLLKLVKDRSSFKLRDGRFPTHFSGGQRNVYSRHSGFDADIEPSLSADDEEAAATFQLSSAVGVKRKCRSPVTLSDLRDTLQRNRNVVASHTVQAINMERILNSFEHQTVEAAEIEEEKRKDEERKAAVDQRQLLTRFW